MKRITIALRGFLVRAARGLGLGASRSRKQVAALPISYAADGSMQVLLVTSRKTRRFIIPKGWPMKGIEDHRAAEIEALEEAGVVGRVYERPIGSYVVRKLGNRLRSQRISVTVFRLDVREELAEWKEKDQRERLWLSVSDAAALITERELADIVRALPEFSVQA